IPCYNEENTLADVLADLPRKIEGISKIETLIINDGSTDKTVEVARKHGVSHIFSFKKNKGLAYGFKTGLDKSLMLGADIVVNTDADNQYCGADIVKLVAPIVKGESDIVIGCRPIDQIKDFSWIKKKLQKIGSKTVRLFSHTNVPDATSGFRAFSREAALRINVYSHYTYTLETLIQAGDANMKLSYVPIRVNPKTRESRLLKSIPRYLLFSIMTIIRISVFYRPLRYFFTIGASSCLLGVCIGIRFLYFYCTGNGAGHIQSLILTSVLLSVGFQFIMFGFLADIVATNRKISEDIQYRIRSMQIAGYQKSTLQE
ncbi:glycosyltransferase family 2 protein, partial [bacterium]|nr:glycosyltransferase family 2 protein [bacterium]